MVLTIHPGILHSGDKILGLKYEVLYLVPDLVVKGNEHNYRARRFPMFTASGVTMFTVTGATFRR